MSATGHGDKYSRLKEQALAALLTAVTIKAAAAQIGIDESTLRTWLRQPDFAAEFAALRRENLAATMGALQAGAGVAVAALLTVASDKTETGSARVAAAKAVLEFATKLVEVEDLGARVIALEARYGATNRPGSPAGTLHMVAGKG